MTAADRPTVAHVVTPYLFAMGSWVYGQLVHLRRSWPKWPRHRRPAAQRGSLV